MAMTIISEAVLVLGDLGSRFTAIDAELPLLLWAVLLFVHAPLGEEAMCRWPTAQRPRTFLLLPGIYVAVAGLTGFGGPNLNYGVRLLVDFVAVAVGLGLHLLSERVSVLGAVERFGDRLWLRWPALPVWFLIACFGLAHLGRFEIEWTGATIPAIRSSCFRGCGSGRW
ncbi:hypothetical protein [Candidatus Poriferisodalis sp.]|uniref:hypothetical protein n=1 Tax=Candidatus Poriferisodalis sp. TaxID=3101277 RepID=UPI003B522136